MGRELSERGYSSRAYHNHTYDYYWRDISHPNLGYVYKGVGSGLEITAQWPESDLEMIAATLPEFIGDAAFHTYYMTVSGHLEYNFLGNMMAAKHKNDTADLPYSEAARAYIACNMEFDQAVAYLIEQLSAAGRLDDTVIVISNDHYPYALKKSEIEELHGGPVEENFELFHSTLIIWNSAMAAPVIVEKPCNPIDILPTLLNLMGITYDSRLLTGRDILDDTDEGIAVFTNHSWISEKGRYNAANDTFTAAPGIPVEEGYAGRMMNRVNLMFDYSAKILDTDYYHFVLP
jgi:arylsulfatase A-like enzyme